MFFTDVSGNSGLGVCSFKVSGTVKNDSQFNVHALNPAQHVQSTHLKDNPGLLQEVFGQRSPHNNSAVERNDRQHHTQQPVQPGAIDQSTDICLRV